MEMKFKRNGEPELYSLLYEPVVYGCDDNGKPNTIIIGCGWESKSCIKIGNLEIHNTHRFNSLQRKMWKLFFGCEIENVKENNNEQ